MASESSSSAGRAAVRGTAFSFLLRILSFTLSQLTLRFVDPTVLGRVSIRLELLLNTALFLGREGFRLALTRQHHHPNDDKSSETSRRRIENVAWLSIPVGGFVSLLALWVHLSICHRMTMPDLETRDYKLAGVLYCFSALVESFSEPLVIFSLMQMDVDTRAAAEGTASLVKAFASVGLLQIPFVARFYPVSAFGMAQLVYSILLSSTYYHRKWTAWPRFKDTNHPPPHFDPNTIRLSITFTLQAIFKHLLTEGDRIILSTLSTGYDQGIYALASSYGGMASRILFAPVEENARLLFSKYHSQQNTNQLRTSFCVCSKLVLYVGLLFACVGVNYVDVLISLLGEKWSNNDNNNNGVDARMALEAFCVYTLILALNGMTEAFVYGVAKSGGEVGRLGLAHAFVGGVFAITAPLLVRYYNTVGLITANGISMILRSCYSIHFAATYFSRHYSTSKQKALRRIVADASPHPLILLAFLVSYGITSWSKVRFVVSNNDYLIFSNEWISLVSKHVGVGIGCVSGIGMLGLWLEQQFQSSMKDVLREKKD